MFIYEISIILNCRNLGSAGPVQQGILLPLPNTEIEIIKKIIIKIAFKSKMIKSKIIRVAEKDNLILFGSCSGNKSRVT